MTLGLWIASQPTNAMDICGILQNPHCIVDNQSSVLQIDLNCCFSYSPTAVLSISSLYGSNILLCIKMYVNSCVVYKKELLIDM